jgi:tetratricopeptide (TPR) repeat protein
MKYSSLAAVAFVLFVSAVSAPARDQSPPPISPAATQSSAVQQTPPTQHVVSAFQAAVIQGSALMGVKDYDGAARVYTKLLHDDPKNATVWNLLGVVLQQSGQTDQARSAYERAIKFNHSFAEAYNNIGTTWYQQQRYRKAERAYDKAVALDPNLATAYSNMGCAYFSEKKIPEALDAFNKAFTLDPDVFATSSHAGTILQDRSVSDHGAFYFLIAKSYAVRNDAANCAEYLRKAYDEGYKDVVAAKTDSAFAKVLADPGVQAILEKATANVAVTTPPVPGT